jgi:hypothetical protein
MYQIKKLILFQINEEVIRILGTSYQIIAA